MKRNIYLFVMAALLMISGRSFAQNNHEYVDLGLPSGTLWATCNVGATTPEGCGDYFAWGETKPKTSYDLKTYKCDSLTVLKSENDAATVNWGAEWCTPTEIQWEELYSNTTAKWTTQKGVNGMLFTGSNGNSIFLPAVGVCLEDKLHEVGNGGYYWSSTTDPERRNGVWRFFFVPDKYDISSDRPKFWGYPVRPVRSAK